MDQLWLTESEVCKILKITKSTLRCKFLNEKHPFCSSVMRIRDPENKNYRYNEKELREFAKLWETQRTLANRQRTQKMRMKKKNK